MPTVCRIGGSLQRQGVDKLLLRTQTSLSDGTLGLFPVYLPRKRVWWTLQTDRKGRDGIPGALNQTVGSRRTPRATWQQLYWKVS